MIKLGTSVFILNDVDTGLERKFNFVLTPNAMMEILDEYSIPELSQKAIECDIKTFANLAEIMCEDEKAKMSVYATPPNETIAMLIELSTFIIQGGKTEKKPPKKQEAGA